MERLNQGDTRSGCTSSSPLVCHREDPAVAGDVAIQLKADWIRDGLLRRPQRRTPANEHPLFVIARPTKSAVAIQLNSRWMATSLRSSP
jgi:hypothetical protein